MSRLRAVALALCAAAAASSAAAASPTGDPLADLAGTAATVASAGYPFTHPSPPRSGGDGQGEGQGDLPGLRDESLAAFSSDVPVVVVDTHGARLSHARDVRAEVAVWYPGADGRARLASPPDVLASADVRLRGASSLRYPKKQFVLRLVAGADRDRPRPLLGMAPGGLVLRASYADRSLLRDALASALARDMGLPSPRARHVEVFLADDGDAPSAADYRGVHVAMENVELGPGRVEVEPLGPGDVEEPAISGGYLLRRDRPGPGDVVVGTPGGERLVLQDPTPERVQPEQVAWITGFLDRLEALLSSPDPAARHAALRQVDVGSFVGHALLEEVTRNADALETSTFFSKPRGGPLRSGPPWDHDAALGNDRIAIDPTGWQVLRRREGHSPWWPRLAEDPDVFQAFADRYAALRAGPLSTGAVRRRVGELAGRVRDAARRNFARWPLLGRTIGTSPDAPISWDEEVANVEGWLALRLLWLDAQWPAPPRIVGEGRRRLVVTEDDADVLLAAKDPRAPGGGIASGAARLDGVPPRRTVLLERGARAAGCGATWSVRVRAREAYDALAIATDARVETAFRVRLDDAVVATRRALPIVRPLRELGSAVRGGRLAFTFPAAGLAAGEVTTLVVTAVATRGDRCELPAVRVVGVRYGRFPVQAGGEVTVRLRRGERWSAPARSELPNGLAPLPVPLPRSAGARG